MARAARRFALLAGPLLLALVSAARVPIQRHLISVKLGDSIEVVQKIYPPKSEWPAFRDKLGLTRYTVEKGAAKQLPDDVYKLRFGMRRKRLVYLQVIYSAQSSRKKPLSELVAEMLLDYGEPRRSGEAYWWSDGSTVARASNVELPVVSAGDDRNVEMLTSLEIMDHDVFRYR
ncbi:MAG: hypothetical protein HY922_12855 [Elusimicrobia bacterium]|nr:hypothetical protein [Elusimicrobiota bacterium]